MSSGDPDQLLEGGGIAVASFNDLLCVYNKHDMCILHACVCLCGDAHVRVCINVT